MLQLLPPRGIRAILSGECSSEAGNWTDRSRERLGEREPVALALHCARQADAELHLRELQRSRARRALERGAVLRSRPRQARWVADYNGCRRTPPCATRPRLPMRLASPLQAVGGA